MTRAVVTADDVRLVFDETGGGQGTPMVLLHALGEGRRSWQPVADKFMQDRRLFIFDLRGHGDSSWPGAYSFELMHADIADALEQLALERVILLGHSMGATIAYLLAIEQPDRVERLVIEDAPPPYRRSRPIPDRPDTDLDFDWAVVPAIVGQVNDGSPDLWSRLHLITAPTLLIGGGPASHIAQEKLDEACGLIPTCTLTTISAGHNVHAGRPDEFAAVVRSWLRSD